MRWPTSRPGCSPSNQPSRRSGRRARVGADDATAVRRVVWLGDSLASGVGAISPDMSLPRLVAAGSDTPPGSTCSPRPGATSADVVHHQLPLVDQLRHGLAEIGQRVDAIGVTVGANDIAALTSRRRFRHNVSYIVAAGERDPGGAGVDPPSLRRHTAPPAAAHVRVVAGRDWPDRFARWPPAIPASTTPRSGAGRRGSAAASSTTSSPPIAITRPGPATPSGPTPSRRRSTSPSRPADRGAVLGLPTRIRASDLTAECPNQHPEQGIRSRSSRRGDRA